MNWYCFIVSGKVSKKGKKDVVEGALKGIFTEDLIDVEVVNGNDFEDSTTYVFAKVSNFESYRNSIANSKVILDVMPSIDNPLIVEEQEVMQYRDTIVLEERPNKISIGSVVVPKFGDYKGLNGIVYDLDGDKYKVKFKIYTQTILKKFEENDLILLKNIFEKNKFPFKMNDAVVGELKHINNFDEYIKSLRKIVSFNKVCRQ